MFRAVVHLIEKGFCVKNATILEMKRIKRTGLTTKKTMCALGALKTAYLEMKKTAQNVPQSSMRIQ